MQLSLNSEAALRRHRVCMFSKLKKSLVVAVALTLFPAAAGAQSVKELVGEVDGFDARVSKLEQRYLKPAMLASRYKIEARYNDARVAYFMQDYSGASILLVDVVRNDKFQKFESFREALGADEFMLLAHTLDVLADHAGGLILAAFPIGPRLDEIPLVVDCLRRRRRRHGDATR